MKSFGHVTVAALAMMGVFATPLIWLVPALVGSARGAAHARSYGIFRFYLFESLPFYASLALFCLWGILTSLGLLRLRARARLSAVALSIATLALGVPAVASAILFAISEGGRTGIAVALTCLLLVPVWWLWLFTRPSVKRQFANKT